MDEFREEIRQYGHHIWLWVVGAAIGLGQLLQTDGRFCWRKALGRAMVSGGLGAAAGLLVLAIDKAPPIAMFGLAAALASLGTTTLERLFVEWMSRKYPDQQRQRRAHDDPSSGDNA
jgi:hypothetical protein